MGRAGRLAGIAAIAVLAAPSRAADPGPSAASFLIDAARAVTTSNFEGEAVYQAGGSIEVLHVVHRFQRGHETEHIITQNGPLRELLQEDDRVTWIMPRDEHMSFGRPAIKGLLRNLTPERLQQLSAWYVLEDLGSDRIAGRLCRGVAFQPQDKYRYGYRLWAEVASHVPLRVTLVTADGAMLEQLMFTEIDLPRSIPDRALALQLGDQNKYKMVTRDLGAVAGVSTPTGRSADEPMRWRLGALPPGFQIEIHDVHRMPHERELVDHMLVSDGLSAISIFTSRSTAGETSFEGLSHRGAVNAYGRVIAGDHVTVVGEAPAAAMRLIGDGLAPILSPAENPAPEVSAAR